MDGLKTGFLFPAFEMKYRRFHMEDLEGYGNYLDSLLARTKKELPYSKETFTQAYKSLEFYQELNDLQKHHLCYISSCALSDYLEYKGVQMAYVGPYSMGLFPSLYATKCVSFEDGLELMSHVCQTAHEIARDKKGYGMGVIVGLPRSVVYRSIQGYCEELEISDETAEQIVIVSGKRSQMEILFRLSREQGAVQSKYLPVELPYHSWMMEDAETKIRNYVNQMIINHPKCPIVSCVSQKLLSTSEEVIEEACTNVVRPLNWRKTITTLSRNGVKIFVECGLSQNLSKMLRMTLDNIIVFHPKKYDKLFLSSGYTKTLVPPQETMMQRRNTGLKI